MRRATCIALFGSALAVMWLVARRRSATPVPDVTAPETGADTPASTDTWPLPAVLVNPSIVVEKAHRRLAVTSDGVVVKHYRVALGHAPVLRKEREGDGRTPEGTFYVCTRGETPRYTHALGVSYPAQPDADRGLEQGIISRREHRTIVEALHRMQRPPWNTALGGEIMIHGGGTDTDWTAGCIALADDDMAELFDAVPLGSPVEIRP